MKDVLTCEWGYSASGSRAVAVQRGKAQLYRSSGRAMRGYRLDERVLLHSEPTVRSRLPPPASRHGRESQTLSAKIALMVVTKTPHVQLSVQTRRPEPHCCEPQSPDRQGASVRGVVPGRFL